MTCLHKSVLCLNEYELIRKYRCGTCSGVMMCACDRETGERFLAHQLREGCVLETKERIPVTLGFVDDICRECRGLPVEAHPRAAIPGQTSKIKRYYWRELQFGVFKRFADRAETAGLDPGTLWTDEAKALREEVEREVLEETKQLHATNPKYDFKEDFAGRDLSATGRRGSPPQCHLCTQDRGEARRHRGRDRDCGGRGVCSPPLPAFGLVRLV